MNKRTVGLFFILLSFLAGLVLAYWTVEEVVSVNVDAEDPLYKEIEERKSKYEWKVEDARIDSVWKKTPGIMGRKVNVEASYKKMKKKGTFDSDLFVYKRITPKVSLDDLPPSPIYRGHPDKEAVTLLINVSWGEEYLPDMIETLSEHQVKANFFIDGAFAKEFTNLVQMIEEEGHTIGSHGYMHKDMARMSKEQATANLEQADELLFGLTKENITYFAPPSGSYSQTAVEAADEMGMETILWTVDTIDWKKPTKDVLLNRVLGKVHNGATILMHPTEVTRDSLGELIEGIQDKGYKITALPSFLSEER
ncbi:polysaccharide deacetylase family protein [Halobacillus sp. ACCC02827]|uniref:polysaccharide deacetylase family protein n=1 Tax=Bacillaceae TaxID=186817 RepID=UPI0004149CCD|nr:MULTISPECIES: polysaccharide deacetylase family protein [Bacillaceae]QHT46703.1 polysaccharide deacetylase family protein [Bacillus sp. SB49]WJE17514.1 polysaccharide deacetylase family protein [Halobacillus sp. ACCC02827]